VVMVKSKKKKMEEKRQAKCDYSGSSFLRTVPIRQDVCREICLLAVVGESKSYAASLGSWHHSRARFLLGETIEISSIEKGIRGKLGAEIPAHEH